MISYILIIISTIIMSAFFSGIEMAFVSSDRFQIELEKKKKNALQARLISKINKNPREFIATMLIGNNISLVIYGIYMGSLIGQLLLPKIEIFYSNSLLELFIQTFISTLLILITAEFLPKLIFRVYSHETLYYFIIPTYAVFKFLLPLAKFIIWISNGFFKIIGHKDNDQVKIFDKEDLGLFILEKIKGTEYSNVESEIHIFHKALDFARIKAKECMVPRNEIIAVAINNNIKEVSEKFTKEGLSKIVVYKNNIDNIIGYIHYMDLFRKPQDINSILLPVEFVYETISAQYIMKILTKKRKSVAIVLDEYGGTAGLITIEDILEELLGNIEDEHDKINYIEKKLNENEFIFSARLEIDYINNMYKLNLPKSCHYETLGGLIVSHMENIPIEGKTLTLKNFYFKVNKVSKNKIEEVLIKRCK